MSQRETKAITCPSGIEAVIKTYLTARETREIENAPLRHADVGIERTADESGMLKDKPTLRKYDVRAATIAAEDELIIQGVVSFGKTPDGFPDSDRVLERILDGRKEDHRFILQELGKVTENPAEPK